MNTDRPNGIKDLSNRVHLEILPRIFEGFLG